MRYPERNKSDSSVINISDTQSIRYPSSSTTDSQDPDENESGSNVGGESNPNVATISEHVLFGNNNGHNSFLYLYYSSSTSNNNTDNPGNIRRPYTTEGGGGGSKVGKMGSQQQWNDLSGAGARRSAHGSARPMPKLYNDDEGEKSCNNKVYDSKGILTSSKSIDHNNDSTPYPVYLSPVEGSPVMSASPDIKRRGGHRKRSVTDNDFQKGSQSRQDSSTADLLDDDDDDDWDKIYSVPTVPTSRYVLSPLPTEQHRSKREESPVCHDEQSSNIIQAKKTYNLNVSNKSSLASSASSLNKHSATTKIHHPQARTSRESIKRVRLTPDEQPLQAIELHRLGTSKKQWSGSGSKKMSPSTSSSSSSSIRSKRNTGSSQPQQTKSQANHHQLSSNTDHVNRKCASSTLTGQDMIDQMSFRNGIGEFFGTIASRNFAKHQGPSPEELYDLEMKGWQPRLATSATIFLAVVFIASCSSLLFVFPILVDPILVGFEAQFSADPVTCRTTNFRNGSGSSECAIPSCREGCTLDLFNCMFVDVEYMLPIMKNSMLTMDHKNSSTTTNNITSGNDTFFSSNASSSSVPFTVPAEGSSKNNRSAILLININGCGYPPEVTCSEFEKKYATVNTKFPCYYSQQNESIVVPHYSRRTETFHLILAVTIPVGAALTSGISLYFLVRHNTALKAQIYRRYTRRRKELKEKLREAKRREQEEEGNTSLSELEAQDDNDNDKNNLIYHNGASKTGQEAR